MRKLAPLFVFTALIGGSAFAATGEMSSTMSATDKMASPTVPANTGNPQNLSYSDKSNTSPGTNAKMDDKGTMAEHMDDRKLAEKPRKHKTKVAKANPNMMKTSPVDSTNGAAANSTTGVSGGQ